MTNGPDGYGFIDDQDADDAKIIGMAMPYNQEPIMGTVPEYINTGIDLVSGKPMSVLETGSCPENELGDTRAQPEPVEVIDAPYDKNMMFKPA